PMSVAGRRGAAKMAKMVRARVCDPTGPRWLRRVTPTIAAVLILFSPIAPLVAGLRATGLLLGAALFFARRVIRLRFRAREAGVRVHPGSIEIVEAGLLDQPVHASDVVAASTARTAGGVALAIVRRGSTDRPLVLDFASEADLDAVRRPLGLGHFGFGEVAWPTRVRSVALQGSTLLAIAWLAIGVCPAPGLTPGGLTLGLDAPRDRLVGDRGLRGRRPHPGRAHPRARHHPDHRGGDARRVPRRASRPARGAHVGRHPLHRDARMDPPDSLRRSARRERRRRRGLADHELRPRHGAYGPIAARRARASCGAGALGGRPRSRARSPVSRPAARASGRGSSGSTWPPRRSRPPRPPTLTAEAISIRRTSGRPSRTRTCRCACAPRPRGSSLVSPRKRRRRASRRCSRAIATPR